MSASIRVAMGQMFVEAGQPSANLERAAAMIRQAAEQHADLIVLPECLDIGWTDPRARSLAYPIPGEYSDFLCNLAKQHRLHIAAGLVERAGDKLYNAAILIDSDGKICLLHRKINELEIAADLYAIGDRLGVAETKLGIIGLDICADNTPDSLAIGHVLARMGAQLIVSPSAWAVPPDHDQTTDPYGTLWQTSYQELSRLYDLPIIGVSGVGKLEAGTWQGWPVIGCSLAVDSDGVILAQGAYGKVELIIVEVNLRQNKFYGTALLDEVKKRGVR